MSKYSKIDLRKIRTYSVNTRRSKTQIKNFGKPLDPDSNIDGFLKSLPKCLKAEDLKALVASVLNARRKKKPIILMLGAHPIKCGLSPVLIDLLKEGFLFALSLINLDNSPLTKKRSYYQNKEKESHASDHNFFLERRRAFFSFHFIPSSSMPFRNN